MLPQKEKKTEPCPIGPVVRRIQVEEGSECPEESSVCPEESSLSLEDDLSNFDGDISKKEIFQLHKLPWPVESNKLLSLRQGRPVMTRRLQELDLSVSPSQPNTPKDGNCMMSSILDQLSFDPYQELCKESSAATNEDPRLWI